MRCDFISNQTPANAVTDHQYINVGRGSFTSVVGYMWSSSPTFPPFFFFYSQPYIYIYKETVCGIIFANIFISKKRLYTPYFTIIIIFNLNPSQKLFFLYKNSLTLSNYCHCERFGDKIANLMKLTMGPFGLNLSLLKLNTENTVTK